MVAGWASQRIGVVNRTAHHGVDRGHYASGREPGDWFAVLSHRRAIARIAARVAEILDVLDVLGRVIKAQGAIADHLGFDI